MMRIDRLARRLPVLIAATAVLAGGPALAEDAGGAPGRVISLTPEQKEAAIESGGTMTAGPAADIAGHGGSGAGQIHGEIGAMIGTGGARGVYGTAAVPLGENAGAILSFEKSRYGRGRGWIPVCTGRRCRAGALPE